MRIPNRPDELFDWVRATLGITDGAVEITMEDVRTAVLVDIARVLHNKFAPPGQ